MALAFLTVTLLGAPAWQAPPALTTRALAVPPPVDVSPAADLVVPIPLNAAVREYLAFFKAGRGRRIYARWLARMGAYRELMAPILEAEGLPAELLYVCMIESGFQPDAVSTASAVGPWQFVRSTGRAYDLRHDAWVDERRDPVKATRAAARHLGDLYGKFGSWPLAIAAYNAGVGAIERGVVRGNTNDYWALAAAGVIPDGPTKYVPKAMAAMLIGQDPARHGFGDVVPEPPLAFALVDVPGGLDLKLVARKAGVSTSALTDLNPELRRAFTPPDGDDYPLRVPVTAQARLRPALESLTRQPRRKLGEHVLRFGERLYDVALRYHTSRRELRRLNKLPARPDPPHGTKLLVPTTRRPNDPDNELLVLARSAVEFAVPGRERVLFPVRQRVALGDVATFFDVAPARLALWNGLDPGARLQRGQVLRVFVPPDFDTGSVVLVDPDRVVEVDPGSAAQANALAFAAAQRADEIDIVVHEVQPGENLWTLSRRYDVPVPALRAENGLARGDGLSAGARLKVPRVRTPKPRGAAALRRPKAEARGRKRYRVRSGDSLRRIADRFGVDMDLLKRRNGLKGARIYPGQELVIP